MNLNFQIFYLTVGIIITLYIGIYSWRQKIIHGNFAFSIGCFASIFWMLADIVGYSTPDFTLQYIAELIRYIGVTSIPVATFVFTRQYCDKHISKKQIILLSIIPVISYILLATSIWQPLFFSSVKATETDALSVTFGSYFWFVHTPYSYLLILSSIVSVFLEINRVSQNFRPQITFLLISLCIPLIINAAGLSGIFGTFNYTPLSFPAFLIVMFIGMLRYRMLWSNPIAYESVFQKIKDGVIIIDRNNTIRDINPAAAKGLNKSPKEVIGLNAEEVFGDWKNLFDKYKNVMEFYDEQELKLSGKNKYISINISPIKSIAGKINGRILTFRDITANKENQVSLEMLAYCDPLTRLANRRKFQQEVENLINESANSKKSFAILFFDLNRFKEVNDTLGHEIGDELLKFVAARVASVLRKPDLLARMGGDEFTILLHDANVAKTNAVVARILENVQKPFKVEDYFLTAELSIGAAYFPQHGKTITELMRNADSAMYLAKSKGGGFAEFEPENKSDVINAA